MSPPTVESEEEFGKAYDARLMKRLLRYLGPYRLQVAAAIALLIGAAGLNVVGPWLTQQALDEAIPAGDTERLGWLALAWLGALAGVFLFEWVQGILTTWLGQSVMHDLRRELFRQFQELDLRFHDRRPVGRLMTRVTSDVETLNELFSSGLVTVFGDIFTLLFIVVVMLQMDLQLALVAFSVLPFVLWTAFLFRARIRDAYRDIRTRVAALNSFLHERFTGMQIVQLFNRERADRSRHEELDADYLEAHLRSITWYAIFFPVIELFTAIALALIIWSGGVRILDGTLTVGVVAAFLQYARRFFRPIQDLSEKYNLLQGAMASSERIFRLLDREPELTDPTHPLILPEATLGEIEFRGVSFAYGRSGTGEGAEERHRGDREGGGAAPDGEWDWVLRDISFRVRPGEKVAIVGHTGAGKTTLINLLMRFYDPQEGEILLDGLPIHRLRIRELRERIGLVLQEVFLFSESVEYNLRLGAPGIDSAQLRRAAGRVGATPFIERLERGWEQPLGERGVSLSVGERQLVSFARALAFDPPILVLDEATSSVDSEIEAKIEQATDELMKGRTSIVIAHRLSTVVHADRILVVHRGRLREEGTHTELLRAGGLYARLHELQFAPPPSRAG